MKQLDNTKMNTLRFAIVYLFSLLSIGLYAQQNSNVLPLNGTYKFDAVFAEWEGKSMGVEMEVLVKDGYVKVIYQGVGSLSGTKKGDIIDEGKLVKHKSGVWIITNKPKDTELEEVGGCTNGPAVIDFENKKYWMC